MGKISKGNLKRKPNVLSLETKCKIIEFLRKGMSVTSLATKFNVAKSTICSIRNKERKIINVVTQTYSGSGKRKTLRASELPIMEKKLYDWFLVQREKNAPVSGPMIKEMAKEIHRNCNERTTTLPFAASDGWLDKFKKRYGIRFLSVCGEKLSAQIELMEPFQRVFRSKISELSLTRQQIYNADESGLFYKMLPNKTFVAAHEKTAPGRKVSKERVTFLLCANATGEHKITPLLIGKSKNPRAFRGFENPLEYKNSKNAWMTGGLFRDWFNLSFVPQVSTYFLHTNDFV